MTEIEGVQGDLQYIRKVVDRHEAGGMLPLGIALYWGLAVLIGFGLIDFAPQYSTVFWLVVGPAGFFVSWWLGSREARAIGEQDHADGARIMWHWGVMLIAILLLNLLQIGGGPVDSALLGRVTLLLVALAYFYAGLHFERGLLWASVLLAAGYVALAWLHTYVWTTLGVLVCIALVAAALAGRHGRQ